MINDVEMILQWKLYLMQMWHLVQNKEGVEQIFIVFIDGAKTCQEKMDLPVKRAN